MDIELIDLPEVGDWLAEACDCLVVGIWQDGKSSPVVAALDTATAGLIGDLASSGELPVKAGDCLLLQRPAGLRARRLLLAGLGSRTDAQASRFETVSRAVAARLSESKARTMLWTLTADEFFDLAQGQAVSLSVRALRDAFYRFDSFRSEPVACVQDRVVSLVAARDAFDIDAAELAFATAVATGMDLARDLGNLPCNICTPVYLADAACRLAEANGMTVDVLDGDRIEQAGMGALLAVARGSVEPPRLIVLQHLGGAGQDRPIALVGKGVTFDAGGISIKPAAAMDEMKFDMCGAAAVLGAMAAISALQVPINVVAVIPACENMPSGAALKPGEIVRSLSGRTIEILNTDAEGRLILADALTYAQTHYQAREIVDVATLTGACLVALGKTHSGLYANQPWLLDALRQAGDHVRDTAWPMPLDAAYNALVDSKVADLKNDAGRNAGSVTAACFLSRFAEQVPWAHLDVAGTAWSSDGACLSTGRPVPLLVRYVVERAKALAISDRPSDCPRADARRDAA